jgi:hypothetical protein
MKITKNQLRRIIKEERQKLINEQFGAMDKEILNPLAAFGQAWSGLGDAIQSQVIDLSNAHGTGEFEEAVYELNPNALDRAFEKLQRPLSSLARDGSDNAMDLMDAMEAAAEIFAAGDEEVESDARAAGGR